MRIWTVGLALLLAPAPLAAETGGDESLFSGTLAQSAAAVVVFLILLVVLRKFAWGPILHGLQDRESKIRGDLERAERTAKEAAEALKEYQDKLAEAQTQATQMIEQGRADAQKIAAGLRDQAQKEIDQMRHRAESDIVAAKQKALGEIYAQAADLTTTLAGRILQREISDDDHQQLINESLSALGRHRSA